MTAQFEQPSQSAWLTDFENRVIGHVSIGGPILQMPVDGKMIPFEMHRYFGPIPLRKDGEARVRVPSSFYCAYNFWVSGGKRVNGDVCVVS